MNVFSEHDRRFEGLPRRVGLFLAVAALIVVAVVVAGMVKHDVFTPTARLIFYADSAAGIHKGMSVQLSGFKIGSVQEMELEPNAQVMIKVVIRSEYLSMIPVDSQVSLAKEGLIGAAYIEVEPGSMNGLPLADNGVLKFDRAEDFADMAKGLTGKIDPILDQVKRIAELVNDPEGDIRLTIRNARQTSAMLAELSQRVNRLAASGEGRMEAFAAKAEKLVDHAAATIDKAGTALDAVNRTVAGLDQRVPELLLKLEHSLANAEAITADARRISSGLSEDLPPMVNEGRGLVEDTREIVDGARRFWPIRTLVPPAREQALPLDSYDRKAPPKP